MGQGQGALDIFQRQRLGVLPAHAAGGGVTNVAHRHRTAQLVQDRTAEHVPHQPQILVERELPVVDGCNAAGLLPPVLQRVQTVIGGAGAVPRRVVDAENAALLVD